jgi:predicted PurR-regulated permease PerM
MWGGCSRSRRTVRRRGGGAAAPAAARHDDDRRDRRGSIGLALLLLGVPLALPLALVTFVGAFVPIIGATVTGSAAVLVALAANGPVTALLTLAAVIAVEQLESNLLQPLIMKRQVRLHPAVILVAVPPA